MKKCLMHVFMASLWLVGCIQDDGWLGITGASEDVDDVEIVLPEKVDDYGKAVAMEVRWHCRTVGKNECGLFGC